MRVSVVVAHRLSCPKACSIFPNPGIKPTSPALADGFLTTGPPGKAQDTVFTWRNDDDQTTVTQARASDRHSLENEWSVYVPSENKKYLLSVISFSLENTGFNLGKRRIYPCKLDRFPILNRHLVWTEVILTNVNILWYLWYFKYFMKSFNISEISFNSVREYFSTWWMHVIHTDNIFHLINTCYTCMNKRSVQSLRWTSRLYCDSVKVHRYSFRFPILVIFKKLPLVKL